MSYDQFTADLIKENSALKQSLDSAVEALKEIHDLANFNEYNHVVVSGLFDQVSFDKGYKAAMYRLHKVAKAALARIKE